MFNKLDDGAATGDYSGAAILPAQYYGGSRERKRLDGEYRLLVAVLEQGIRSYFGSMNPKNRQQRIAFEEARRWFYGSKSTAAPGLLSFESICELLEIDAGIIRQRLGSIRIRALPTHRQPTPHSLAPRQRRARRQRTAPDESAI